MKNSHFLAIPLKWGLIYGITTSIFYLIVDYFELNGWFLNYKISIMSLLVLLLLFVLLIAMRSFRKINNNTMEYINGIHIGFWVGIVSGMTSGISMFLYLKFINEKTLQNQIVNQVSLWQRQSLPLEDTTSYTNILYFLYSPSVLLLLYLLANLLVSFTLSLFLSIFMRREKSIFE